MSDKQHTLTLLYPYHKTIQSRFMAFHREHPEVYVKLVQMARQSKALGKPVGIGCLWENLRWNFWIEKDEEWKMPNDYRSRYARVIMENNSDLEGFFETRGLRTP